MGTITSTGNSIYFKANPAISPALEKMLQENRAIMPQATTLNSPTTSIQDSVTIQKEVTPNATEDKEEVANQKAEIVKEKKVKAKDPNEKKPSLYERGKRAVVKFLQNCNTASAIAIGTTKGATAAIGTLGFTSLIGKSVSEAISNNKENKQPVKIITDSIGNIFKDSAKAIFNFGNFIVNIPNKTTKENVKSLLSPIPNLYGKYLNIFNKAGEGVKTHLGVAIVATVAAAIVFSVKFLKEKYAANEKNANIEHKTNLGHVKQ